MKTISCDFETNNSDTECRVWMYGAYDIDTEAFTYGTSLDDFMRFVILNTSSKGLTLSFHNLKFDGEFIVIWLLNHGYEHNREGGKLHRKQFSTLISDMGAWYTVKICFDNGYNCRIIDTLKIYPFSIKALAKSFHFEEKKGEIDYDRIRPIGYKPTREEIEYQKNDVVIAGKALRYAYENNDTRMTAGSNALEFYKRQLGKKLFAQWFPPLDPQVDDFIRKSYRGGWTYVNSEHKGKAVGSGIVLDVNSLYPWTMRYCRLPYGEGCYYVGKYQNDEGHPLYVQKIQCAFKIKKGYLPTVQIKGNMMFRATEYVKSSNGEVIDLVLTSVDLDLFLEHYETKYLVYVEGYKYKATDSMFAEYIDYWIEKKIQSEKDGDFAMRTLSKLKMNSLYGKFAKRPKGRQKYPYLEEGVLKFELSDLEDQKPLYLPVGTFITAWARDKTIRSAQKCYDRFLYADTDSLHILGVDPPEYIEVDKYKLGAWKHEGTFWRAKYLGSKCYVEDMLSNEDYLKSYLEENPKAINQIDFKEMSYLDIKCAGLPESARYDITFENFEIGLECAGKLAPKHVQGGQILKETTYKIKTR